MARILVIEDQPALCRLYDKVLGHFGHDVVPAYTGEAGVAAATSLRPDLIILDLLLPGMTGSEVAQKLRDAGILPATPLIVTTGLSAGEAASAARSLGAADFLTKPFDVGSILTAVQRTLPASPREPPSY